jgi:hypothetical protein
MYLPKEPQKVAPANHEKLWYLLPEKGGTWLKKRFASQVPVGFSSSFPVGSWFQV